MARQLLSPRTKRRKRRICSVKFERLVLVLLLFFAWGWVFILMGIVFYHGYFSHSIFHGLRTPEFVPGNSNINHPVTSSQAGQVTTRSSSIPALKPYESPLIIFTFKRDNYLRDTLTDLLNNIPRDCSIGCPIVISQDGNTAAVSQVIADFTEKFGQIGIPVVHLQHVQSTNLRQGATGAYQALAVHYGWGLTQIFQSAATASGHEHVAPQRVLILEEDLHTSTDFFEYFAAMAPILDADTQLLAVSAFNDNGYDHRVRDPARVLRSDFFPGLGWMMNRQLWDGELKHKWPGGYWDDWLREPAQRQDRHILRPEVSRTFHFGVKGGSSGNQFGNRLGRILLDTTPVDWIAKEAELSQSLQLDQYDADYWKLIRDAQHHTDLTTAVEGSARTNVVVTYKSFKEFQRFARHLELMDDEKAGIPRTAYKGIVETRPHGEYILFLTPPLPEVEKSLTTI